jgi:hypothetical protein
VVCRSPQSQEEGRKGDLVGLLPQHTMLKTKEFTVFSSLTRVREHRQIAMMQTYRKVSQYEFEVILCLPEQSI